MSLPEALLQDEFDQPSTTVFERVNDTQVRYRPMSQVNPTGAVVPATMAQATWDALQALQGRVGDIDQWLSLRLRWSRSQMGEYLTSEQVDGVALAVDAADRGEGLIIADQTGFGKGRILAATARAMILSRKKVIFLTEKANLFSDFWRDVRDIASEELFGRPLMMNDGSKILDTSSKEGRLLIPAWKKVEVNRVLRARELPQGTNLLMATYSQFNRKGTLKAEFLEAVAEGAHLVLDEAHNFVGDSTTSKTVGAAVEAAGGSIFSSATFARDVTNLAAYSSVFPWLSRIPGLEEMSPAQRRAIAEESVRLATEAGRILRREHDLTNMTLQMSTAEGGRLQRNEELADDLAPILSRMAQLARRVDAILEERNEANRQFLETLASAEERKAEREVFLTANFGSRLSTLLTQFLVALNVEPCIEHCVETLLRGGKPVVVIETTMEALMRELASDDGIEAGETVPEAEPSQGSLALDVPPQKQLLPQDDEEPAVERPEARPPTFREALCVLADRLLKVSRRSGAAFEREQVTLDDASLVQARDQILDMAQAFPDLSLSPIDDIRDGVEAAGRRLLAQGLIKAPWCTGEISARSMRVVNGAYVSMPSVDRNQIVAGYVNGATQMLVLTQAASTGLSLHDSEKFSDRGRRHMIEVSPPRNVLARIQMWGRVWRRGQLTEPDFTVLDTGLPFNSYDLAARNRKLSELSASVTGTSKATVALDVPDPIDAVGNDVAHDFLQEQQALAEAMGISLNVDRAEADRELYFVGKLFRHLPLMSTEKQRRVYKAFYAAYEDRLRNGGDPSAGRELDGVWEAVRREVLEAGDGSDDPLTGRDVLVTTIRTEREAKPLRTQDVVAAVREARGRLGENPFTDHVASIRALTPAVLQAALPSKRFRNVRAALQSSEDNPVRRAEARLSAMEGILATLLPGQALRLPSEDGEVSPGIVIDIRAPSPTRANVAREYEVIYALPGDERPRSTSLDAMARNTNLSPASDPRDLLPLFDAAPGGMVSVERKVLDGNGIGAILASARMGFGTRASYTDKAGRNRTAVLIPRSRERNIVATKGRTNLPEVALEVLSRGGRLLTDPMRPAEGVEIRPNERTRTAIVVIPPGKRAAKGFETAEMLDITGEFRGDFRERTATVAWDNLPSVLRILARGQCQFFFDAAHRAAAVEATRSVTAAGEQPNPEMEHQGMRL